MFAGLNKCIMAGLYTLAGRGGACLECAKVLLVKVIELSFEVVFVAKRSEHFSGKEAVFVAAWLSITAVACGFTGPVEATPSQAPTFTKLPGQSEELTSQQQEKLLQLETALAKSRRAKGEAEADALYQLAQYLFSIGQANKAEGFFRQSLSVEDKLHRQEQSLQVRIALAHLMMSQKRTEDALSMYREALAVANKNKNSEQVASVLDNMASCLLLAGDFEQAEKLLMQSLESSTSPVVKANALINLAAVSAARSNNQLALERSQKAIESAAGSEELRTIALAYRQEGRAYANMGDYQNAISSYRQAAKNFEEDVETILQAQVLLSIGQLQLACRQPQEAKIELKKAIEIARSENDLLLLIECMIALGAAEADTANFDTARSLHAEASKLAHSNNNQRCQYLAASEEGFDFLLEGKVEKALDRFLEANSLVSKATTASVKEHAGILRDLGLCYRSLGQMDAAIKYYLESASLFESAGDVENQALLTNSVAVVYLDMGRRGEFEKEFELARSLAAKSKSGSVIACLAFNKAQFDFMERKFESALKSYKEAIEAARAAKDLKTECMSLNGLGFTCLAMKNAAEAKNCFLSAAKLADAQGLFEARWDVALGLGKTLRTLGQDAEAEVQLKKAVGLVEKERTYLSRDTFKTFSLDLRQECFLELIDLYASTGRAGLALEQAEKGRARAFLDLLAGRVSRSSADTVAVVLDGQGDKTNQSNTAPLVALVENTQDSAVRGIKIVPRASTLVESSAYSPVNAAPPSLSEIIELVKRHNSYVVEYCMLKDKLLIWVISPDGEIKLAPPVVISSFELKKKILETHNSIAQTTKIPKDLVGQERTRELLLRDLYSILIQPVKSFLPEAQESVITFVPHGALFSVPFAALMSDRGKYLVEECTVSYLPAIGVLRATEKIASESDRTADNTLLAFGNPITKVIAFLGTLPFAEKEVKKVAALFSDGKATIEVGADATKTAYRNLAPKNSIIHLATHGLISEEKPMESALVLAPDGADDGLLTVKDILTMPPLKAKMVVLSACQTGRGKITGDGVVGLSRAFIIAGAPSVVVSQWNVDDVMTEYQMCEFYKSFLSGKSKAAALREAQLKTIGFMDRLLAPPSGQTANRPNPRLWAAFQLIGATK